MRVRQAPKSSGIVRDARFGFHSDFGILISSFMTGNGDAVPRREHRLDERIGGVVRIVAIDAVVAEASSFPEIPVTVHAAVGTVIVPAAVIMHGGRPGIRTCARIVDVATAGAAGNSV